MLKKILQLFLAFLILFTLTGGFFAISNPMPVYAQDSAIDGLETVADESGLGDQDIKVTIAKLIRTFLTILGIIAVLIVLYGGFVWMTAGGDGEKVDKAKKILINGGVGLFIILMSYSITTFVLSALTNATGSGGSSSSSSSSTSGLGGGSATTFSVSAFSPEGEVAIRNIKLSITFSRNVDEDTVEGNVVVTNASTGAEVDGTISVRGNKVSFVPTTACPEPNTDRYCFDENTTFNVEVSEDLESTAGKSLDCSAVSCQSSFTSGELVDTEDPEATVSYPDSGDRISVDSSTTVQVSATDDSQVSTADFYGADELFDSVTASGDDLSDVTIESTWYTDDLSAGTRYTIEVTVEDIAGNTDTDSIRILAEAVHCSNEKRDEDEEGKDCGGADCGACDGASCEEDEDCSSGTCEDGTCVSYPEISGISPDSGAEGTYVTISGENFGSGGSVYFIDENGDDLEADVPACADWSDEEIVVEVPVGAVDGPITVETSSGYSDSTDDDNGQLLADFDVNDTVRPSLCKVSPDSGEIGDALKITGVNFEDSQGDSSEIYFDDTEAGSYTSWSAESVKITVPTATEGETYALTMTINGVESNELSFDIEEIETDNPIISYLDPDEGGKGQYVTIYGSDFGGRTGSVYFENDETGYTAVGSADFPDACEADFWSDSEITIIVPDEYSNGDNIETGAHSLYVVAQDGSESASTTFTVTDADPTPGICKLDPDSGKAGDTVVIYGEKFGSSKGSVEFYETVSATVTKWSADEITVTVPSGVATGPVTLTSNGGEESNSSNFEVSSDSSDSSSDTMSGGYAWYFSTGEVPETPELLIACDYDTNIISGVPNKAFTSDVCTLAVVYGTFTTLMDTSTLSTDNIVVSECSDSTCKTTTAIESATIENSSSTSKTSFTWTWPTGSSDYNSGEGFKASTTYQVLVSADVESESGVNMESDVKWTFTTGATGDNCEIEEIILNPQKDTITDEGGTTEFQALASGQCQVYSGASYIWDWALDSYSYASISAGDCDDVSDDSCALATALNEGTSTVYAEETDSGVIGLGTLIVDYTDPYVSSYWPDCNTACVNASLGASFNIGMLSAVTEGFSLFSCANELCVSLDSIEVTGVCTEEETDDDGNTSCKEVQITPSDDLEADTYYRVIVSGDVESDSGVSLTQTNYGDDFSWIFSTKNDATLCAVDRVDLTPDQVTLKAIGDTQQYSVQPYGEPDSCSVAGQKLNGYSYNWDWARPYDDEGVALIKLIGSLFADSDSSTIPDGCTTSCLATGSESYSAVCGDSSIGTGEDCDDGNATDGDGCSASCLREGSNGSYGTCGDGTVDQGSNSEGEDCDDSNTTDGDGCSASCLREGSSYVGATCGNSSVAQDENGGGEDCDDGNRKSGDGCSSQCLNEGSTAQGDISAQCGDGKISTPYETCDDGNTTDGDGCSSSCLREGSYGDIGTCGNGITEKKPASATVENSGGEDCDGTAGCGSDCLLAGSSLTYNAPSVCGDGNVGRGELPVCESGTSGDGKIDPLQLAIVLESAALMVDEDTNLAQTTIKATYEDEYDTAMLYLQCSAEDDSDCQSGYGPADNQCCMARPTVNTLYPSGTDECRNTAIYAIFSDKMDTNTFIYKDDTDDDGTDETITNVYIKYEGSEDCSELGYDTVAYSSDFFNQSWLAEVWNSVKSFLGAQVRAQSTGDCLLPITGISQASQEDGTYKVNFQHNTLLEAETTYTIYIKGGTTGDESKDGVLSAYGVEMDGDSYVQFTTGTDLCELDKIDVEDTDADSPYLFTATNEEHAFTATAYSFHKGSKDEIESIDDVYSWEWASWKTDDSGEILENSAEDNTSSIATASYSAVGENGEVDLTSSATITSDIVNGTTGDTVSGTTNVVALLCENTWPSLEDFPFIDDATGTIAGLEEGAGWMNFSMYYCRDSGKASDTSDDLGALTVTPSGSIGTAGVIKEYFFAVTNSGEDTGDAIGLRIAQNEDYLSPSAWYSSQGFAGSPSEIEVSGYSAIQDGRTAYVAIPNESSGTLYANIFVISYNEGASSETIGIFNQLLETLTFNTNLESTNLCYDGSAYTATSCESDLDCGTGKTCGDEVSKITRDMKRLTDVTTTASQINIYQAQNDSETPRLSAGTYVSPISASAWPSWQETLSSSFAITLNADPLNQYTTCSESADYNFDSATCVDQTKGVYACPEGSHIYHYRAFGEDGYYLTAELEYTNADWYYDIDNDTSDNENILIGGSSSASAGGFNAGSAFCDGSEYGASTTCGDGVIGGSEVCEIGDINYESNDSDGDGVDDCKLTQKCNSDCSAYATDTTVECSAFDCGNGVVETGEECDDGSFNGSYGYCGSDCSYDSAFYCGDGTLAGSEVCDCGVDSISTKNTGYSGSACVGLNSTYDLTSAGTCSWDCSEPGPYCGDESVDSSEECDGNTDTYSGSLCFGGDDASEPCDSDNDCGGGGSCGNKYFTYFNDCPETTVCLEADDADDIGIKCDNDNDCGSEFGLCSSNEYQTTRTRTCADDSASGDECTWSQNWWYSITCKAELGNCGNGTIDDEEECDDGNDDNTDSCTNECTSNVCGDGYLYSGEEQCDDGSANGEICSSAYGSTCSYCNDSCKTVTSSGNFCGDGEINGSELCDGADVAYHYYSSSSSVGVLGTCTEAEYRAGAKDTDDDTVICTKVGICNGGDSNGEYCTSNRDCSSDGSIACETPECADNCKSVCPFTYSSDVINLKSNLVGAKQKSTVTLSSYSETSGSSLLTNGNSATMYIPACRATTGLTADVDFNLGLEAEVLFVTDLSYSMTEPLGDSDRMTVTKSLLKDSVESLFDELGESVTIGLVGMVTGTDEEYAVIACSGATGYGDINDVDVYKIAGQYFHSEAWLADLEAEIDGYSADCGTHTYSGLAAAKAIFEDHGSADARKIAILLSDGEWDSTGEVADKYRNPQMMACKLKDEADVELFTIMLSDGSVSTLNPDGTECDEYKDSSGNYYDTWDDYYDAVVDVSCGNGTTETSYGEECDDGNSSNTDSCTNACQDAECGDGHTQLSNGEDCDDSGESATCDSDCTAWSCGDGTLNGSAGEDCDNGEDNGTYGDSCTSECLYDTTGVGDDDVGIDEEKIEGDGSYAPWLLKYRLTFERLSTSWQSIISANLKHIYAATVTDSSSGSGTGSDLEIEDQMALWSSGNPNEENGITYAYVGETASELAEAYQAVIDAITGASLSFIIDGSAVQGTLEEGDDVSLPWPEGFACDESGETEVPFRILFEGSGTVTLSNVSLQYCEP